MSSKQSTITVRIDPALKAAFQRAAKIRYEDMSAVLTRAIVEYVKEDPKPLKLRK